MFKLTYATPDTDAMDTVDAIDQAHIWGFTDRPADTDGRNAVSRRIVEVTDQDENIIPEFIDLDPDPFPF